MFYTLIAIIISPFYPNFFFSVFFTLFFIISIILFFLEKDNLKLRVISASYFFSYLAIWLTTNFVKYEIYGTNGVFRNQLVEAYGFPLVILTDDAGMTDFAFHSENFILNFFFYFLIILAILFFVFRKKLKK